MTNTEGDRTRTKAYRLKDFLDDCKNQEKIMIDKRAEESAQQSPLHLYGKKAILDFLTQEKEEDFEYVNTKEFKNGVDGENPLVDSYKINFPNWDLYIAFCLIKVGKVWFIKSFHPDKSGETLPLAEILRLKRVENKR